MKGKKILVSLGAIFLGAVIVSVIDELLGISFKDVGLVASTAHKMVYMIWGVILLYLTKQF